MSDIVVAKRYAKALFEVAKEKNIISQVEEELKSVASAIRDNADLQKFLNHPNIGTDRQNGPAEADFRRQSFRTGVEHAAGLD